MENASTETIHQKNTDDGDHDVCCTQAQVGIFCWFRAQTCCFKDSGRVIEDGVNARELLWQLQKGSNEQCPTHSWISKEISNARLNRTTIENWQLKQVSTVYRLILTSCFILHFGYFGMNIRILTKPSQCYSERQIKRCYVSQGKRKSQLQLMSSCIIDAIYWLAYRCKSNSHWPFSASGWLFRLSNKYFGLSGAKYNRITCRTLKTMGKPASQNRSSLHNRRKQEGEYTEGIVPAVFGAQRFIQTDRLWDEQSDHHTQLKHDT